MNLNNNQQLNFWIKELKKPKSKLIKLFKSQAKERAELWSEFLKLKKNSPQQKELYCLAEGEIKESEAKYQKELREALPYLFAAYDWPMAGGGLDRFSFDKVFKKYTLKKRDALWRELGKITCVGKTKNMLYLECNNESGQGWKKFFDSSAENNKSNKVCSKVLQKDFRKRLKDLDKKSGNFLQGYGFEKTFQKNESFFSEDKITLLQTKLNLYENIADFVVELPSESGFEVLKFHQELLIKHFQPGKLLLDPDKHEGALLGAFWEYKSTYIEKYTEVHAEYFSAAQSYFENDSERQKMTRALSVLNQIDYLKTEKITKIESVIDGFDEFVQDCVYINQNKKMIAEMEEGLPYCSYCQLEIDQKFPKDDAAKLDNMLKKELSAKVSKLRNKSVEKILRSSDNDISEKIIDVLHLADFNKIIDLIVDDKSGKVFSLLQKILNNKR